MLKGFMSDTELFLHARENRNLCTMMQLFASKTSTAELAQRDKKLLFELKPRIWMNDPTNVGHLAVNQVALWLLEKKPRYFRNANSRDMNKVNCTPYELNYVRFLLRVTQALDKHLQLVAEGLRALEHGDQAGFQSMLFLLSLVSVDNEQSQGFLKVGVFDVLTLAASKEAATGRYARLLTFSVLCNLCYKQPVAQQ